ncbi:hypothetical protein U1Q18_024734, partial [Sarracenia purpurea var. burkii]
RLNCLRGERESTRMVVSRVLTATEERMKGRPCGGGGGGSSRKVSGKRPVRDKQRLVVVEVEPWMWWWFETVGMEVGSGVGAAMRGLVVRDSGDGFDWNRSTMGNNLLHRRRVNCHHNQTEIGSCIEQRGTAFESWRLRSFKSLFLLLTTKPHKDARLC